MADTLSKLMEISSRIEHLEQTAEWIARETVHSDNAISQSGTLICVLADELREHIYTLVHELEQMTGTPNEDEDFTETIH